MGYRQFLTLPFLAAFFLISSGVFAQQSKTVSILIEGESEFDVIYSRAMSNATGAVIGGLIGAGIQSSVEADRDSKLREEFEPMVHSDHWQDHFLDVLNERLEGQDISAHWAQGRDDVQADMVLQLKLDDHGFRLADSNTMMMAAFVEFEYRVYPAELSRRDIPDFQQAYVTNKAQRHKHELLEDEVMLNQDLNEALTRAARRMANKIIYWRP